MTWWHIALMLIGFVVYWCAGYAQGYRAGKR